MSDVWARLGDEQAIRDVLARYWRGIDRRDPALVLGTYHPGAFDDHGYYKGPVEGFVETLVPGVWSHFANTQHFAGNLQIDFAGPDAARVESYAEAHHIQPDPASTGPGSTGRDLVYGLRYVDDFERRDGEWRIARRVCAWDWHRIDPVGGIPLPASYFRGCHSQDDPVYAHPRPDGRRVAPEALVAVQGCLDALTRYTRGVDRCDPALVRSAYHPDAWDDHGGYQGDVEGFVDWLGPTVFAPHTCTMHKLGNVLIRVEGRRAWAETYAIAHHVAARTEERAMPDGEEASDLVMGVRYLDRFEDRGEGWKIAWRRMSFEWERMVAIGSQRAYPGFLRGLRDGQDPVLERSTTARPAPASEAADRAAILRQLVRYCRGVDRRDLELVRSTYHPDAYDDHGHYKGDVEGFLAFVAKEVHARFRTTMHKLGQSRIELEGDVARVETYAICHHVVAESEVAPGPERTRDVADLVMGIRYLDRFERRGGTWRIARRALRWEWVRTDPLEPLDPGWTAGRADAGDPIFAPMGRAQAGQNS
ncbi:MAG: nuclear transport factor 2 family protein [Myxococcota bacterium]